MAGGSDNSDGESTQPAESSERVESSSNAGLKPSSVWLGNLQGEPNRRSLSVDVPHVRQSFNWDCGLACVLMVLRTLGVNKCDLRILRQLCNTTSIWTVDLAHLFARFGVAVHFCTITVGANPEFAKESFYMDTIQEDGRRVERLFRDAAECGITIQCRSLAIEEIQDRLLSGHWLLIALVDKRKLSPPQCLSQCCGIGSGYTGHYVVVCGYDADRQEFELRDPASSSALLVVSESGFEDARKAFGTDEDILLVSRAAPDLAQVEKTLGLTHQSNDVIHKAAVQS
mmetsp:Transcript_43864/g.73040  ORF Transcript_43864/g.73040 Transcript_43864/m.73040 type:complete len:285 (-) Transcript_43864:166-1020(-)|eukprot:CAMPEP_0198208200 /NCGR_PEP_ID=MMETSP1445-20131203/11593_1 /TAXON_ID=36898 /ORGANISM="Pyramimonas sp., Strain CCMP2087" /LENGTH=284 /DNA_ID=CAMNT_0043881509 /DNA_START=468 /DNA_END=1322 /DNA_ORIENTATION=-